MENAGRITTTAHCNGEQESTMPGVLTKKLTASFWNDSFSGYAVVFMLFFFSLCVLKDENNI